MLAVCFKQTIALWLPDHTTTSSHSLKLSDPPEQLVNKNRLSSKLGPCCQLQLPLALSLPWLLPSCSPNWHACSVYVSKITTTHWFTSIYTRTHMYTYWKSRLSALNTGLALRARQIHVAALSYITGPVKFGIGTSYKFHHTSDT
jgi:hypothetical protein